LAQLPVNLNPFIARLYLIGPLHKP